MPDRSNCLVVAYVELIAASTRIATSTMATVIAHLVLLVALALAQRHNGMRIRSNSRPNTLPVTAPCPDSAVKAL